MGEDRERVLAGEPDEGVVAEDVEGHSLAEDLPAERGAVVEDEDVEGHSLLEDLPA